MNVYIYRTVAHATVLFASIEQTKNPEQRKPLPGIGITYPTYLTTLSIILFIDCG